MMGGPRKEKRASEKKSFTVIPKIKPSTNEEVEQPPKEITRGNTNRLSLHLQDLSSLQKIQELGNHVIGQQGARMREDELRVGTEEISSVEEVQEIGNQIPKINSKIRTLGTQILNKRETQIFDHFVSTLSTKEITLFTLTQKVDDPVILCLPFELQIPEGYPLTVIQDLSPTAKFSILSMLAKSLETRDQAHQNIVNFTEFVKLSHQLKITFEAEAKGRNNEVYELSHHTKNDTETPERFYSFINLEIFKGNYQKKPSISVIGVNNDRKMLCKHVSTSLGSFICCHPSKVSKGWLRMNINTKINQQIFYGRNTEIEVHMEIPEMIQSQFSEVEILLVSKKVLKNSHGYMDVSKLIVLEDKESSKSTATGGLPDINSKQVLCHFRIRGPGEMTAQKKKNPSPVADRWLFGSPKKRARPLGRGAYDSEDEDGLEAIRDQFQQDKHITLSMAFKNEVNLKINEIREIRKEYQQRVAEKNYSFITMLNMPSDAQQIENDPKSSSDTNDIKKIIEEIHKENEAEIDQEKSKFLRKSRRVEPQPKKKEKIRKEIPLKRNSVINSNLERISQFYHSNYTKIDKIIYRDQIKLPDKYFPSKTKTGHFHHKIDLREINCQLQNLDTELVQIKYYLEVYLNKKGSKFEKSVCEFELEFRALPSSMNVVKSGGGLRLVQEARRKELTSISDLIENAEKQLEGRELVLLPYTKIELQE